MQTVILIERSEWDRVLSRLDTLETWAKVAKDTDQREADKLLSTKQVAKYLGVHVESVRRARREGRLTGVQANERDWSFRRSEVERYTERHRRV